MRREHRVLKIRADDTLGIRDVGRGRLWQLGCVLPSSDSGKEVLPSWGERGQQIPSSCCSFRVCLSHRATWCETTLFPGQPTSDNPSLERGPGTLAGHRTAPVGGIQSQTPGRVTKALRGLHGSLTSAQFLPLPCKLHMETCLHICFPRTQAGGVRGREPRY